MSLLSRLTRRSEARATPEDPLIPLSSATLLELFGGEKTYTGRSVDEKSALKLSAVFACIRVLAETVAQLPLILYERTGTRSKRRAVDHPLYSLLHDRPHPSMAAMVWRETMQGHLGSWGNAYARKLKNGRGVITQLAPLLPDRTTVSMRSNQKVFVTRVNGRPVTYDEDEVLHIPALGYDGVRGYSPIAMARQAIGAGLTAEEYGARWFAGGARPAGVLQHPQTLSAPAQERLRARMEQQHGGGPENAHKIMVLEEGMTWQATGIPPEESQFLETRNFNVLDIARFYRMPPHKIGQLERATFSNIEHQSIDFVVGTMLPWLTRWEQEINWSLLTPEDRGTFFFEFLVDGLLRGDIKTRYEAYAKGRQWGWLSANDVRELENLPPVDGGDVYHVPLNMVPADEERGNLAALLAEVERRVDLPRLPAAPAAAPGVEVRQARARSLAARRRAQAAQLRVFRRSAERVTAREVTAVRRILRDHGADDAALLDQLRRFYEQLPEAMRREYEPVLSAYAEIIGGAISDELGIPVDAERLESFTGDYLRTMIDRHNGSSLGQLEKLARETDPSGRVEAIETRLGEWADTKPGKLALRESVRAAGAFAHTLYGAAGVTTLTWWAFGRSCPLCSMMHGRTVGTEGVFLGAGDRLEPGGETAPLVSTGAIRHPPLHGGCDCQITPG